MTQKALIVTALLHVYPAAWRSEYGSELEDILLSHRIDAGVVANVVWNALGQRVRMADPSSLLGLAMMVVLLGGFIWNIAAPPVVEHPFVDVLRQSSKTLPTVVVRPLGSDLYVLVLVWCGYLTQLRHRRSLSHAGIAAVRLSLIAGIPVIVAGGLMLAGVLGIAVVDPGHLPATVREHTFSYTYYGAERDQITPVGVLLSPLFKLPESWVWGVLGGWLGRRIARTAGSAPVI